MTTTAHEDQFRPEPTSYTITDHQAVEAAMAFHAATDMLQHLAQLADARWLSGGQAELRAEWAFAAYDRLVVIMEKIPRPDGRGAA